VIWIDKEAEAINDYLLSVADEALARPGKKSSKKRGRV